MTHLCAKNFPPISEGNRQTSNFGSWSRHLLLRNGPYCRESLWFCHLVWFGLVFLVVVWFGLVLRLRDPLPPLYVHHKQPRSASPSERFQFVPLYSVHYLRIPRCPVCHISFTILHSLRCLNCASKTLLSVVLQRLANKFLPMDTTSSIVLRNCWTPVSLATSSNFRTPCTSPTEV